MDGTVYDPAKSITYRHPGLPAGTTVRPTTAPDVRPVR